MAYQGKIAFRYAKAINDFLKSPEKARATAEELMGFGKVLETHKELSHVLTTEVFSEEQRRGVVEDLAAKLGVSKETTKILLVLSSAQRLGQSLAIAERL